MLLIILTIACVQEYPDLPNKQLIDNPIEDFDGDRFSENDGDVYPDGSSADNNPDVYPGAPEICDGLDNDLNGEIDDDPMFHTHYYKDKDQDLYGDFSTKYFACFQKDDDDIEVLGNRPHEGAGEQTQCNRPS